MIKRAFTLAVAALALGAPAAAHARTDDFSKPVLFVSPDGNCGRFATMEKAFAKYTTTVKGNPVKFAGTTRCFSGTADELATFIRGTYDDKAIDVVAYEGGGLTLRAALAANPKLKIEDAVAIATPNTGSTLPRNPQGAGGTDWSVIGSDKDSVVPAASAVDMDAAHKTIYESESHSDLLDDSSDKKNLRIRYAHDGLDFHQSTTAPYPVQRVAQDLIFGGDGSGGLACGVADTAPDQCGVTPVIMVPGFGASELVCDDNGTVKDMWPGALSSGDNFLTMSLNASGSGPETSTECSTSIRPTGMPLQTVLGFKHIHIDSTQWLQRVAAGHFYTFGWDFRKGPDKTLKRMDQFIDYVRRQHGVNKVAIVTHSYGGLLTRWYVDDPTRAKKVTRVANFGSPFWGAPKAWFAVAYGYETPEFQMSDNIVRDWKFKHWTQNLAGMYYLFPSQAWYDHVPGRLQSWLEMDEHPTKDAMDAAHWAGVFGGNTAMAQQIATNHAEHIDGFTRANGVDWRIFVGSGNATLGHVRAYTNQDIEPQYSWVNGDGTVPLVSQRQSIRGDADQMGTNVPTYNFCNIGHMGEMEDPDVERDVTPFITEGKDPIIDSVGLQKGPCRVNASEFRDTGSPDAKSISISTEASATMSRVRAHASQAPSTMTIDQAEAAGLIQTLKSPGGTTFITETDKPLTVSAKGSGTLEVTPITGEGARGDTKVYDITASGVSVTADGAKSSSDAKAHAADKQAPRTTVRLRGRRLVASAKDASGIAVTLVQTGRRAPRVYRRAMHVPARGRLRAWSVDKAGNTERKRVVRR